jgi:hypothetical protein
MAATPDRIDARRMVARWRVSWDSAADCFNSLLGEMEMSKPNTIKIDEVEYVRADSVTATEGDIKIIVVDRGFVYVGRMRAEMVGTSDFIVLSTAKNIRVWGTTKGLGELVSGPLSNTKLDSVGTVRIPMRAVISVIDVEQSKWKLS